MNHRSGYGKLGRTASHRKALLRNMATSLVLKGSIETTVEKAKELKRVADRLVTLGKNDTLHSRRQAMEFLMETNKYESNIKTKRSAVHTLFTDIAPKFSNRNGGYTRVIRTRLRQGDNAQLAIIQFVEALQSDASEAAPRKRRVAVAE